MIKIGVITGLKNITGYLDEEESRRTSGGGAKWVKLKGGESVKIVFLQELDPDSPNFSEKNGLGLMAVEHSNPAQYQRKALCTIDDGECFGCEKHREDFKAKWGGKKRLYVNVLVVPDNDDPYVAVLSQGFNKSIFDSLVEQATEFGTITDRYFKIKRQGSEFNNTSYTLTALKEHDLNVEDYEVYPREKFIRDIPYAEQEAFYMDGLPKAEKVESVEDSDDSDVW